MPKLAHLDVICPMCAESYLETTNKFDPTIDANAGMLKLKQAYTGEAGNQWTGPPPDPTAGYGMLECPGCEAPLAPSGYLIVKDKEGNLIKMGKKKKAKLAAKVQTDTLLVCPKCRSDAQERLGLLKLPVKELVCLTQVEGKEGVASCPVHGEMTLEELGKDQKPISELDKNYPDMTGEGKWICPNCKREFKKKAHLGSHMRVHKEK